MGQAEGRVHASPGVKTGSVEWKKLEGVRLPGVERGRRCERDEAKEVNEDQIMKGLITGHFKE